MTNSVVANCVVLVPAVAVGAVGIPVKDGEFDNATLPFPVDDVTPVPPLATATVPEIVLAFTLDDTVGIFKVVPDKVAAPVPIVVNVIGDWKSVPGIAAVTIPLPFDFNIPFTLPAPPTLLPITVPLHTPDVIVPTVDKLEFTTLLANDVPESVDTSEVIYISELPSKDTPLIRLGEANFVAVLEFPIKFPVILVADNEFNPVTDVTVPPKDKIVDPNVIELFANCPLLIAAFEAKLFEVRPVAEILPEAIEIPEPGVRASWIPKFVIFDLEIFNFEKSIDAFASTSAFKMVDLIDK